MAALLQKLRSPVSFPPETRHDLRLMRLLFLCMFGGFGITVSYFNLYLNSIGLSTPQIGQIAAVAPIIGMIGGPIWGLINDRLGMLRPLLSMMAIGAILIMAAIPQFNQFLPILLLWMAMSFVTNPVVTLLSGGTMRLLRERPELYGRQRFWGSVGFILTSFLMGYVIQALGLRWLFYGYIAVMVAFLISALQLRPQPATIQQPLLRELKKLMQPAWIIFTVSMIIVGIADSGMMNYLGIYISNLGGSPTIVGWSFSIFALSEVPVLMMGPWLIRKFGTTRLIFAGLFFYIIRFLALAVMPSPIWALPIGLLQGPSFCFLLVGGVELVNRLAPDDLKSTAQGLFITSLGYLPTVIGSIPSGIIFKEFGAQTLFFLYCGLTVAAIVLSATGTWLLTHRADTGEPTHL